MIRTHELKMAGDEKVLIVDGLVSDERVASIDAFCRQLPFHRIRYAYRNAPDAPMQHGFQWVHLVTEEEAPSLPVQEIRSFLADRGLAPGRAHLSCIQPGDTRFAHIDDASGKVLTAVYFCNRSWERDWAGELVFFDAGEAAHAVSPLPGRVVFFSGNVVHRGGVPTHTAGDVRFALAHKFVAR